MNNDRTTPDNPATSTFAESIECAIGLNTGDGGAEGVYAARDAVLAIIGPRPQRLPADVLALFPPSLQPVHRSYLSDACRTARLIDGLIIGNPERGDLPGHRDQLHQDCAGADPYTGTRCQCHCHPMPAEEAS